MQNDQITSGTTSAEPEVISSETVTPVPLKKPKGKLWLWTAIAVVIAIALLGSAFVFLKPKNSEQKSSSDSVKTQEVDVKNLSPVAASLKVDNDKVVINGQLQANQNLVITPTTQPQNPVTGTIYLDKTTNILRYFNGQRFIDLTQATATIANTNTVTLPQNLETTADPVFGNLTLTGLSPNGVVVSDGSSSLKTVTASGPSQCLLSSVSGPPVFGNCANGSVGTINGKAGTVTLQDSNGYVLFPGSADPSIVEITLPQSVATTATPTFGGLTINGTSALRGATTIGITNTDSQFTVNGPSLFKIQGSTDQAFLIQNNGGNTLFGVKTDSVQSLINDGNFDNSATGALWAPRSDNDTADPTVAYTDTTSLVPGSGALMITNPASGVSANGMTGAFYAYSLAPNTTYTVQVYAKRLDTKNQQLRFGYLTGADMESAVESGSGFCGTKNRISSLGDNWLSLPEPCTFTTGGSGGTGIYFRTLSNDGIYAIDKVIMQQAGSLTPESNGRVDLAANTKIQAESDSAFYIQNSTNNYSLLNFNSKQGTLSVRTTDNELSAFEVHNADDDTVFKVIAGSAGNLANWNMNTNLLYRVGQFQPAIGKAPGSGASYAYVIGGRCLNGTGKTCPDGTAAPSRVVQYAELSGEGDEQWQVGVNTGLPRREEHAVVYAKGYVYVIGGQDETGTVKGDVYYNKVGVNGNFESTWQPNTSLTNTALQLGGGDSHGNDDSVRFRISAVYYNDYIYVVGGEGYIGPNNFPALDTVVRARVFANGTLGPWTFDSRIPALPNTNGSGTNTGLSRYAVAVNKGYIYVVGGQNYGGNQTKQFFYAPINPDGSLGVWVDDSVDSALPIATRRATGAVGNDYFYFIGGDQSGVAGATSPDIYYTHLASDGSPDGWNTTPGKIQDQNGVYQKRSEAGTFVFDSKTLYIVGGNSGSYRDSVITSKVAGTSSQLYAQASLHVTGTGQFDSGLTVTTQTNTSGALLVKKAGENGGELLNVDTALNRVTLGGQNTADVINWHTTKPLPAARSGSGGAVLNGYVYNISGSSSPKIFFSKLRSDGSLSDWLDNSVDAGGQDLPGYRNSNMTIAANGYIYVLGGENGGSSMDTVYFARPNLDGSITNWKTSSVTLETPVANAGMTVANGYIYVIGGDTGGGTATTKVQYAQLKPDGTLGGSSGEFFVDSLHPLPSARLGNRAVFINGNLYVTGGENSGGTATNNIYSAALNTNGSLVSWNTLGAASLPVEARAFHASFVANGYLYIIAGRDDADNATKNIYYSKLLSGGQLGAWSNVVLSEDEDTIENLYNHTALIVNGFVYVIGGKDESDVDTFDVFYGSTARVSVGGSLDLVGLGSETLTDSGGGGQLTAGNTTIVGTLDVRDAASFGQSVVVNSTLTAHGDVLLQSDHNSSTAFQIQNAAGNSIFNVNTASAQVDLNGNLVLGTSNTIYANNFYQTADGQNVSIFGGNNEIVFTAGGIEFRFPTTGPSTQEICTTAIICASGGGQAVLLAPNDGGSPGSAQSQLNSSVFPSIFINNTGGADLLKLQSGGSDVLVLNSSGTLIVGTANSAGAIRIHEGTGANYVTLNTVNLSGNRTFSFPDEGDGIICINTGNCAGTGTGATVPLGGTAGTIAVFTGTNSLGNSDILNDTGTGTVTIQGAGGLVLGIPTTNPGKLLFSSNNSETITLQTAGGLTGSTILTIPDGGGTICTTITGCASLPGFGGDLQSAYEAGNTITTTTAEGDVTFILGDSTKFITNLQGTSNTIEFQDSGTTFATFADGGTTTFKVTSPTAFIIQSSTPTNLFTADTTDMKIKIGNGSPTLGSSSTGALYVTDASEFAGRVLIGTAANGADFDSTNHQLRFTGTARNAVTVTLMPEYVGAALNGTGIGTMTADFCSGSARLQINYQAPNAVCTSTNDEHNYYSWTTQQGSAQSYYIYVRYKMPSNFDGFNSNLSIKMFGWRTTGSDETELTLLNSSNAACGSATTVSTSNTAWTETPLTGSETADAACTAITADSIVTFRIKMTATTGNFARAGAITFTYFAKF